MIDLPQVAKYNTGKSWVKVVRGDQIPCGLKSLALQNVDYKKDYVVFASNSHGYGPVALTNSLIGSGKTPVIFLSKHDFISSKLQWCEENGAMLDFSGESAPKDSDGLRKEAIAKYTDENYQVLTLGLGSEDVRRNVREVFQAIVPQSPKEVWVTVASGVLIQSLMDIWPLANFHAVMVKKNDTWIGRAEPHIPLEEFDEPALIQPPYPSAQEYDAKTWQFMRNRQCRDNTLVVNVAR